MGRIKRGVAKKTGSIDQEQLLLEMKDKFSQYIKRNDLIIAKLNHLQKTLEDFLITPLGKCYECKKVKIKYEKK